MPQNDFQKPDAEQELIKSALNSDLDESSVDIFAQDLFAPPKPEIKEAAPPEPAPEPLPEGKKPEKKAVSEEPPDQPEKEDRKKAGYEKPAVTGKKAQDQKPAPCLEDSSPGELREEKNVEELDLNIETGELKSLAASKGEEELDETEESLTQLEKMTDDFMSVNEMKKLYKNMNLMIDMLNLFMVRLDALERKLKAQGVLKDQ
jgi:hypothetical protein